METLQTMVQLMLLSNYLHERVQEGKGESSLAAVPPARRSKIARLGRQMVSRVLMALGQHLSGIGKHLLEEAC
jgi:hypothetical protein